MMGDWRFLGRGLRYPPSPPIEKGKIMLKESVKKKAKKNLSKLQSLLKKAAEGKDTGDLGSELFVDDVAQLIKYYRYVAAGNFSKAATLQTYDMDTATYDRIDEDIFNFVGDEYHPVKVVYESDKS